MTDDIVVRGARENNLRGVDVALPRGALVALVGPSGSGKTTLAFDVLYAEAQRRYVATLGAHARSVLEKLPEPDVDWIDGLSPAVAARAGARPRSPRTSLASVTEAQPLLALLYGRAGTLMSASGEAAIAATPTPAIVDALVALPERSRFEVRAPIVRGDAGDQRARLSELRREGFVRVVVDGAPRDLGDLEALGPGEHELSVIIDRIAIREGVSSRIAEAIELARGLADGFVDIAHVGGETVRYADHARGAEDEEALPALSPRLFSARHPEGACPACEGLGVTHPFDEAKVVDASRSLRDGAALTWGKPGTAAYRKRLEALPERFPRDLPVEGMKPAMRRALLHGGGKGSSRFEGIIAALETQRAALRARATNEEDGIASFLDALGAYTSPAVCDACGGTRLRPEALRTSLYGVTYRKMLEMPLAEVAAHVGALRDAHADDAVLQRASSDLHARAALLVEVGLGYLTFARAAASLSAGELARARLATRLAGGLHGVLYVLDEPSTGLHRRDVDALVKALIRLRDRGASLLVVTHEEALMRAADQLLEVGPGAGAEGGRVMAQGAFGTLRDAETPTGRMLRGELDITRRSLPRAEREVRVEGATLRNLDGVSARFPIGRLTCVTGPSGSGKSTLVGETLVPAVRAALAGEPAPNHAKVHGAGVFSALRFVDATPIGRSPKACPATFVGVLAPLRELYAQLPEARAAGYGPARFSFNKKGGRCELCQGQGVVRVDLAFLPDVVRPCELCEGKRYERETLRVRFRGWSIADALAASVDEARAMFAHVPKVAQRLDAMAELGLGYLSLGQAAPTLSGGEAQRLRLARELARARPGPTLYVLDEPASGLHGVDVEVLVHALDALVSDGHTVVCVEHDLRIARIADHLIDMGPAGGPRGGRVLAQGTPREVAAAPDSVTGPLLFPG